MEYKEYTQNTFFKFMTEKEKKQLFDDEWPPITPNERKILIKTIKKASISKIFEYKAEKELIAEND